jgi:hypothetical protein
MERTVTIVQDDVRHLDHIFVYPDSDKTSEEPIPQVRFRFAQYAPDGEFVKETGTLEDLTPEEAAEVGPVIESLILEIIARRQASAKAKPEGERTKEEAELASFSDIEVDVTAVERAKEKRK